MQFGCIFTCTQAEEEEQPHFKLLYLVCWLCLIEKTVLLLKREAGDWVSLLVNDFDSTSMMFIATRQKIVNLMNSIFFLWLLRFDVRFEDDCVLQINELFIADLCVILGSFHSFKFHWLFREVSSHLRHSYLVLSTAVLKLYEGR